MGQYVVRRLLQAIPMLLIISIVLFALINLAPGGPTGIRRSRSRSSAERVEMLRRQFGLDKPLPVRYVIWLIGNDWMNLDTDGDGVADEHGERRRRERRRCP